jgi:hypothetical protein
VSKIILSKVKLCSVSLRMLQLCRTILSYLISFLRYKCLILYICHPDTLYLRDQGCEYPWLFFERQKGAHKQNHLGNTALYEVAKYSLFVSLSVDKVDVRALSHCQSCATSYRLRTCYERPHVQNTFRLYGVYRFLERTLKYNL